MGGLLRREFLLRLGGVLLHALLDLLGGLLLEVGRLLLEGVGLALEFLVTTEGKESPKNYINYNTLEFQRYESYRTSGKLHIFHLIWSFW